MTLCSREALSYLSLADPAMAKAISLFGPLEVKTFDDLYTCCIYQILSQQISMKAASTLMERLNNVCPRIEPDGILSLGQEGLGRIGIPQRKAGCILDFSSRVLEPDFEFNEWDLLGQEQIIEKLCGIKGIGFWTAEMILLFGLQHPDVFSIQDKGIRKGLRVLHPAKHENQQKTAEISKKKQRTDEITLEEFRICREMYAPYGSTAALYCWKTAENPALFLSCKIQEQE